MNSRRRRLKRKLRRKLKKQQAVVRKRNKLQFAERLNRNLPDSEKWFWREWEGAGMKIESDRPNAVFCGFIPDVLNRSYGYVIEVDGSIHERDRVKAWDEKKNKVFAKEGMTVFRLEAYNYDHFGILVDEVSKIRDAKDKKPVQQKSKTILRRLTA